MSGGSTGEIDRGLLPTVYSLDEVRYLVGGLLFGIATLRARILPRWAAGLLADGTVAPLAGSLLPHEFVRLAAVLVGVALAWPGSAFWSERREHPFEALPESAALEQRRASVT